ncbi:N-acetylmuramoyl-L-alanine amidase [Paenibacillus sp. HB172176]|uniref:N-acetylmuramoyl-L-alanine amidase family protein n=1 Tax=Paenibacillus sp. HB172176 TaxID=2493690 RepID=UPI00143940E2|nr:N-acetylmuramoyl-L-alanine amidase [Paenibacillus sp. HB172176]
MRHPVNPAVSRTSTPLLIVLMVIITSIMASCSMSIANETLVAKDAAPDKLSKDQSSQGEHSAHSGKIRIVIDAGHGGKDPGAEGASGKNERDYTLDVALRVSSLLQQNNKYEVKLTRSKDVYMELEDRAAFANDWEADLFLSIHGNTYTDSSTSGTETLYSNEQSLLLAGIIQEHVADAMGFRNRGLREEDLKVTTLTHMPAALVEIGFLTNAKEEKFMLSEKGKKLAAQAIVNGINQYVERG